MVKVKEPELCCCRPLCTRDRRETAIPASLTPRKSVQVFRIAWAFSLVFSGGLRQKPSTCLTGIAPVKGERRRPSGIVGAAANTNPKRQRGPAFARGCHCVQCLAGASGSCFLAAAGRMGRMRKVRRGFARCRCCPVAWCVTESGDGLHH